MIKVSNLNKEFKVHKKEAGLRGSIKALFKRNYLTKKALDNISFEINEGEIVGLIGSNGAGKTTLAKILSGIIFKSAGEVSVLGFNPWDKDNQYRSQMSLIMGQKASLWWDLPAYDCYLLLKEIYQIPDKEFKERLEYLSEKLSIKEQLHIQIRRLSLGERMKTELIAALLHNPKVVFLDEPTIGLDLTAQTAVREFIKDYRKKYKPIMILTSHYMEDIESLCERIIILKEGKLIYDGKLQTIRSKFTKSKVIKAKFSCEENMVCEKLNISTEIGEVLSFNDKAIEVKCPANQISSCVQIVLNTYPVHDLEIVEPDVGDLIEKIIREGI